MAKLRLENEWKMWLGLGAVFVIIAVYLYMVSRPPTEGGEPLWHVTKVIDAQNISLKGSGEVVQFKLAGLQIPQSEEEAAKDFLTRTLLNQWVRIKVLREEPKNVKEGFILLSGEDINARMVRQGMAEIKRDDAGFDVRPYIELEQEAKREKRGLWKTPATGAQ